VKTARVVYVIEFTSATVKVGSTKNAVTRHEQHEVGARAHGHTIAQSWYSAAHVEWKANERHLLAFCRSQGGEPIAGAEYFRGVSFDLVRTEVLRLPFTPLAANDSAEFEAQRSDYLAHLVARREEQQRASRATVSAREIRRAAGMTMAEMAAALGVSESSISRWEGGSREPEPDMLLKWAALLEQLRTRAAGGQ
jgi:DNA-binding transcriptional regulator YiaG